MSGAIHGWWCNTKTYPTHCPSCNHPVFYFSCDCGCRVFFNKLGQPWPIHSCHSAQPDSNVPKISPKSLERRETIQKPTVYTGREHDKLKPHSTKNPTPKIIEYTGRGYDMPKPYIEESERNWGRIARAYQNGDSVTGSVSKRVKGGLQVIVEPGALLGFLPVSQVELHSVQNLEQYVGQVLKMKIINVDRSHNDIILSRRALLEVELAKKKANLIRTLKVGKRMIGVVKKVTAFGAFVDLGGIDGLLHKANMARKHVRHPSELVTAGEEIEVRVVDINRKTEKISLGLKDTALDPWVNVEKRYLVGSTVQGKVINIVNFGVFLQLEKDIEGLIHISELANRRIENPTEIVSTGEELKVKIINVDPKARKIGLSLKALIAEQHHSSATLKGRGLNPNKEHSAFSQRETDLPKRKTQKTVIELALRKAMEKSSTDNPKK